VTYKKKSYDSLSTDIYAVKNVFIHPKYDKTYNDIALVQLTKKIRFKQEGQLACIGSTYQLADQVDAYGYGPQNINLDVNSKICHQPHV
jgi:Trypsin